MARGGERKISTIIKIGGEQNFKKAIKAMNQELTVLSTEMQKVTSSFDKNDSEADKLRKTQEALGKQIAARKDQIEAYNTEIGKSAERYEKAKQRVEELTSATEQDKKAISAARNEYNSAVKELQSLQIGANKAETALNDLNREYEENRKALKKWSGDFSDINGAIGKIGKGFDGLKAQLKEFGDQTEEVRRQLVTLGTAAGKIGGTVLGAGFNTGKAALEAYGKAAITVGTAVAGLGAAAVKVGTEFESSLSTVAATMGLTIEEIENGSEKYEAIKKAAIDAGKTTKYTASEAAEALNYLALAGYDAEKSAQALPGVLNLAAAGNLDLATASDLATDALAALSMDASELDTFMDKLAKTSQKSNTNVSQLGEATLVVAGTAKMFGLDLDKMNASLGVLANRGIKGAEGGTQLRNVLLSLSAPTDKAAKELERLGVSVSTDKGNIREFDDILEDLNKSLSSLSKEDRINAISNIFNKRDIAAVDALLAGLGEEFDTLVKDIDNSKDAAQNMADVMMNNLSGSLTMLKSVAETAGLQIKELADDDLKALADSAREAIVGFSDALEEGGGKGALEYVEDLIPKLGREITEGISDITPEIVTGFNGILTAGIGSFIENIPGAVDGIGYPMIEGFRDAVDSITQDAENTLPEAVEKIGGLLIDSVPILIDSGFDLLLGLGDGFAQALPELLSKAGEAVKQIGENIQEHKGELIEVGSDLLYGLGEGLEDALPDVLIGVAGIAEGIVEGFYGAIADAFERSASNGQASMLEKVIVGVLSPPLLAAQEIIEGSLRGQQTENSLQDQRNEMYHEMETYIIDLLKQGKSAEEAIRQAQHDLFGEDPEKMKFFQFEMYDTINEEIVEGWRKNLAETGQIFGSAKAAATDAAEGITESEREIREAAIGTDEAAKTGGGEMARYYEQMGKAAIEAREKAARSAAAITDSAEDTTEALEEEEKERQENAKEIRQGALDNFKKVQQEEKSAFTQKLKDETDALKEELKNQTDEIKETHKNQTEALKDAQKKQQDAMDSAHQKRLDQIDEEYLEQLKLVDEEAYNRIKAKQDEIDAIDAQTEREDRERELAEEADKRRRLQEKIWNAQTEEERREAQQELNDFEEGIRQKRIREERAQRKENLGQEIEDIKLIAEEEEKRSELQQKVWDSDGDAREKAEKELADYEAALDKKRAEDGRAEKYADLILNYENAREEAEKERDLRKNVEDAIYEVQKTHLDAVQTMELEHLAGMQAAELAELETVQKKRLENLEEFQKKQEGIFDAAQKEEYNSLEDKISAQLGISADTKARENAAQSESIFNAYVQGRKSATENISAVMETPKEEKTAESFLSAATDFTDAASSFQRDISLLSQSIRAFEQAAAAPKSDYEKVSRTENGSTAATDGELKKVSALLTQILNKTGTQQPLNIEIKVKESTIARAAINGINANTRTTGKFPLIQP